MLIRDLMSSDMILTNIESTSKAGILNELIGCLDGENKVIDLDSIRKAVHERESIMSTNIGNGFAIPHAKTDAVKGIVVVFGKTKEPILYDSGKNYVRYFFLVISNNAFIAQHIKLLCQLSLLCSSESFREKLSNTDNPEEIMNLFDKESLKELRIAA